MNTTVSKYTHMKRPYRAICMQLTEYNQEEVISLLLQNDVIPHAYDEAIMVRFGWGKIDTILPTFWVVIGENGDVKFYPDGIFHIKYEQINYETMYHD